jgi:hypothetical protein
MKGGNMSQEILEIVKGMDLKDIETQLALQCAPLITDIKTSNLLIVQNDNVRKVKQILSNTNISQFILMFTEQKTTILLYKKYQLESYISQKKVRKLLKNIGYQEHLLDDILHIFQLRYKDYIAGGKEFPHEMGLLLGYPVEDVEEFIKNEGKNFLYTGYWKVYENLPEKVSLFRKFELAKETLIQLVSFGISIVDIIDIYSKNELSQTAV